MKVNLLAETLPQDWFEIIKYFWKNVEISKTYKDLQLLLKNEWDHRLASAMKYTFMLSIGDRLTSYGHAIFDKTNSSLLARGVGDKIRDEVLKSIKPKEED